MKLYEERVCAAERDENREEEHGNGSVRASMAGGEFEYLFSFFFSGNVVAGEKSDDHHHRSAGY